MLGLCPRDIQKPFECIQKWSIEYGLPLHVLKCKYIGQFTSDIKCEHVKAAKSLGVTMHFDGDTFRFTRDSNQNLLMACSLTPATNRVPTYDSIRDVIASFHMGCYAQPVCLSHELTKHSSPGSLCKSLFQYDKHILKIIKDFCNTGRAILSINRICSEFGLFNQRFGVQLIKASARFHDYISELPDLTIARQCSRVGTQTIKNLKYAKSVLLPKLATSKNVTDVHHWANSPKKVRHLAWRFFITPDTHQFSIERVMIKNNLFCG